MDAKAKPRFILGDLVFQSITQLNETMFQMSEEDNSDIIVLSTSIISASDLTKPIIEYISKN